MGARLGQHFLKDAAALDAIVAAAGVRPGDRVLEIGPGKGALTRPLLAAGASVTAIELDDRLASALPPQVAVINEDFLKAELPPGPWIVVGNLPYAVATPILQRLLLWPHWERAALMFQKEVAERCAAETGTADYGLLALSVRLRADAELVLELPPEAFVPRPKVDSAVVLFRRLAAARLDAAAEKRFWTLAKAAFSQRRKMASGVLSKALGRERAEVEAAFASAGIAAEARPEDIPFEAWCALARSL